MEREQGLDALPKTSAAIFAGSGHSLRANVHPTVKPIALMRWLVRLTVPVEGVVLDPFAGSGSTIIAAVLEGRQALGIERQSDYVRVAAARIAYWATVAERERGS